MNFLKFFTVAAVFATISVAQNWENANPNAIPLCQGLEKWIKF